MTSRTRGSAGFGGLDPDPGGKEWLAAIVESSTDAIIGKTLDGTITDWNAAAAEMYGYQAQEMIGRKIDDLFPDDHKDELPSILEKLRHGERIDHFETKRVRKDGTLLDVSVSISPVLGSDGAVIGGASLARDISGRIRAEAERRAAVERAHRQSDRLETVGLLVGGLAHDFNNMLSVILGYAEQISAEPGLESRTRSDLENIFRAAQHASQLTKELMIFSRQEGAVPRPLTLDRVLSEFRSLLAIAVGGLVKVDAAIPPDLPAILANPGRLEHALLNLAVNARDAMPDGGTLTLTASQARLTDMDGVPPGQYIRLSVRDTGSGMTQETARHAIEPFYSTKPVGKGTGLGLSSVYGIVTSIGGTMTIDSWPGAGTTVHLYFPAAATAEHEQQPAAAPRRQAQGETVLVVDDEPAVLAITSRMLRRNGYRTLEANNGADALRLLATEDCQLLLTDQVMPGMTGAQLARHAQENHPRLAVLHMTGSIEEASPEDKPRDDLARLIRKPFTEGDLIAQIHAAIARPTR